MNIIINALCAACGAVAALVTYILIRRILLKGQKEEIIKKAEIEAEKIKNDKIFQAKEKFLQLKSEHEQMINEKNKQISEVENRLKQKENSLNQQNSELGRKNKEADAIRENLKVQVEIATKKTEEYEKLRQEAIRQIENIAGMTAAEAKNQLVESMKEEAKTQAQSYINDMMDEARLTASKEAKRIVINTIQRIAPETAIENAVTIEEVMQAAERGELEKTLLPMDEPLQSLRRLDVAETYATPVKNGAKLPLQLMPDAAENEIFRVYLNGTLCGLYRKDEDVLHCCIGLYQE